MKILCVARSENRWKLLTQRVTACSSRAVSFFQSRRTVVAIAYVVFSFDWSAGTEATTNAAAEPPSKPSKTVRWVVLLLILVRLNQVPIE